MRYRLFHILESDREELFATRIYNYIMLGVIFISLLPLTSKTLSPLLYHLEIFSLLIFLIDYLLRWATADLLLQKGLKSFFFYPITPLALLDLACLVPYIRLFRGSWQFLRVLRLARVIRILKLFRHSKNTSMIWNVLKRQRESLFTVGLFSIGYIFISALIMFNVEPQTFDTYFDAVYWATISLTTVGYGDLYATTTLGRAITMLSALLGTAIVALPAGIITAGYMEELKEQQEKRAKRKVPTHHSHKHNHS